MGILTFIIIAMGLYNWYYGFEIEFFSNIYDTIMALEINGYPIFSNLLGDVSALGFFNNYDYIVILILSSIIIGWIYGLKINDYIDGFKKGCKQMLKPALYSMLASLIFTVFLNMLNNNGGDYIFTIINKFVSKSEQFSLFGTIGSSIICL